MSADRIFAPLAEDHPIVRDRMKCPVCWFEFQVGDRVKLVPRHTVSQGYANVEAVPVHAECPKDGA